MNQTVLTETEIAWLAGLLEGEGYFAFRTNRKNKRTPAIVLKMTDLDIVQRAQKLMDAKSIYVDNAQREGRKVSYTTAVIGYKAIDIMKAILPYMGERRGERIKESLTWVPVRDRYDRLEEIVNECGHPDRPPHARRMCLQCYNKNRKVKGGFAMLDLDL